MSATPTNPYLRTKILTASPEELRLMLYEGAVRFCNQAKQALEQEDYENSYTCLMRAQKIVLELSTSLDHQAAPEICDRLSALYSYIYRRLVDANMERDVKAVDESITLLEYETETWKMLMAKLVEERGADGSANQADLAGAQQTAISSLSLNG